MRKKYKGIKKLNNAVSALFTPFGITSTIMDCCYSYDFEGQFITFNPFETCEDDFFSNFVEEKFGIKDKMPILTSFLHEVGHHKTCDLLTEEEWDYSFRRKKKIFKKIEKVKDKKRIEKIQWEYFSLPDEFMATEWAVDYIKTHPKKAKKMNAEIEKAFKEFYKENEKVIDKKNKI